MAKLKFFITDLDGKRQEVSSILSYQLSKDWDAACDGLRLEYLIEKAQSEICIVEVYMGDKRIFNGYVDSQRERYDSGDTTCFIYARSSACLLTDNEAEPCLYSSPSALALYVANARSLGFSWDMPDIYCDKEYLVSKGVSCFGAINDFVEGVCGSRIVVDGDDCISLLKKGDTVCVSGDDVISEARSINRGDVVTQLDYKTDSANGYDHHLMSRFFDEKGIKTSKKSNLLALPAWQRDTSLLTIIRSSARDYYVYDLVVESGDFSLGNMVRYHSRYFGEMVDMLVVSLCYILDEKGERIRLSLSQDIDLKEITYVD